MQAGDQLPDFEGRALDGGLIRYRDLWQKKAVLIVTVASAADRDAAAYLGDLSGRSGEFRLYDAALVIRDASVASRRRDGAPVPPTGIPIPSVIIADRWGEVRYVGRLEDGHLPAVDDVVEWLRFVQTECPECQGETR